MVSTLLFFIKYYGQHPSFESNITPSEAQAIVNLFETNQADIRRYGDTVHGIEKRFNQLLRDKPQYRVALHGKIR